MNERIDEFMIQSGARFEFLHGVHYDDFQYKTFAELIVRECAKIADIADENKCEWIGGNILTHFGVEE
jgi:hypothetical protein